MQATSRRCTRHFITSREYKIVQERSHHVEFLKALAQIAIHDDGLISPVALLVRGVHNPYGDATADPPPLVN
jgi:hypothetical protein